MPLKTTIIILALVGTLLAGQWVALVKQVQAANPDNFKAGNIISDKKFTNGNAMSPSQIQNFLEGKNSVCLKNFKTLSLHDANNDGYGDEPYGQGRGNKVLASRLIWQAAQIYNINPKVILVTLQKEQGLITRGDCPDWRYNTALGYGCPDSAPCNQKAYGFTRQIDYGVWHFRGFFDDNLSFVPYTPGNRTIAYHPNGSCGSTKVNIINRATASLYSYTPYQPNRAALNAGYGTGNACSSYGNRNFWMYYTDWFGSPTDPPSYTYSVISKKAYGDSLYQNEIASSPLDLEPGENAYIRVVVRNTGNQPWNAGILRLGTKNPQDRASAFSNDTWRAANRPADPTQNKDVYPANNATFEFKATAPSGLDTYNEGFGVLLEGKRWIGGAFNIPIEVSSSSPYYAIETSGFDAYRDAGYTKSLEGSTITAYQNEAIHIRVRMKNIGNQTLPAGMTKIATTNPNNRSSVFRDNSWLAGNRPAALESSLAPGETETLEFTMTPPSALNLYNEMFGAVIEGERWLSSNIGSFKINVKEHPPHQVTSGQALHPGEKLMSRNNDYRLIFQGDGNLVLYGRGKALWASRTVREGGKRVILQGDGNLVMYASGGKPVWHTRTNGKDGSRLILQGDGNLVLYTSGGKPVWHTRTNK